MPARYLTGSRVRGCRNIVFTVVFSLLGAGNIHAGEDPYLDLLEAEAGNTAALQIDRTQSNPDSNKSRNRHQVPEGLSFPQFEQALKKNHAGTNALYNALNREQRTEVYQQYRHNRSVAVLRQKILNLQVNP